MYFKPSLRILRFFSTDILLIIGGSLLFLVLSCSDSFDSNSDIPSSLTIEGKIYSRCNNAPLENIYIKLFGRYASGVYIHDALSTQSDGSYRFNINSSGGVEFIQIGVNNWMAGRRPFILPADSNYSVILYDAFTNRNTKQNISLPPRVTVRLRAIPDPAKNPAEFIRLTVREVYPHLSHSVGYQTNFDMDSIQVQLGSNLTHSIKVKYLRDNNEGNISKDFFVDCSDTNKVTVFY